MSPQGRTAAAPGRGPGASPAALDSRAPVAARGPTGARASVGHAVPGRQFAPAPGGGNVPANAGPPEARAAQPRGAPIVDGREGT